jgi:Fe-S cluster assembly scaffold protein SufB
MGILEVNRLTLETVRQFFSVAAPEEDKDEVVKEAMNRMDLATEVNGIHDDEIKIDETAYLNGSGAKGVLTSRVALGDNARADIYNKISATAPYARGHIDCKEIVQDHASANAVSIVDVRHPKAHVTHEAAIGSVDNKQRETLLTRGVSEDKAVDLIIDGLLR